MCLLMPSLSISFLSLFINTAAAIFLFFWIILSLSVGNYKCHWQNTTVKWLPFFAKSLLVKCYELKKKLRISVRNGSLSSANSKRSECNIAKESGRYVLQKCHALFCRLSPACFILGWWTIFCSLIGASFEHQSNWKKRANSVALCFAFIVVVFFFLFCCDIQVGHFRGELR